MLILVDLDGTLLPLESWDPVFYEVAASVASRIGIEPGDFWGLVKALHYQLMRRLSPRAFDWQYLVESVAASFGVYEVPRIEDVLNKYVASFSLYDGALDLLKGIRDMGFDIAIATNGLYQYQYIVIKTLGLDKYIKEIRTSDMYGCIKNCKEFFDGGIAMIGDNPVFDVYFPQRFGLRTIFVGNWADKAQRYGEIIGIDLSSTRPDYAVRDLREALRALRETLNHLS